MSGLIQPHLWFWAGYCVFHQTCSVPNTAWHSVHNAQWFRMEQQGWADYHTSWSQKRAGSMQISGKSLHQYMVWAVTEMLRNLVQNPDTKIHSLSLITALRHLRGAGICWILRNRYCHVIAFQKYEATPVSPAGEIDNEAGEYKFPEANHQKASTH